MSIVQILLLLIVAAAAGWLAMRAVRGSGIGFPLNIIVGGVGALLGGWLLPRLGVKIGGGVLSFLVTATIGAILLLLAVAGLQRLGIIPRRIGR